MSRIVNNIFKFRNRDWEIRALLNIVSYIIADKAKILRNFVLCDSSLRKTDDKISKVC